MSGERFALGREDEALLIGGSRPNYFFGRQVGAPRVRVSRIAASVFARVFKRRGNDQVSLLFYGGLDSLLRLQHVGGYALCTRQVYSLWRGRVSTSCRLVNSQAIGGYAQVRRYQGTRDGAHQRIHLSHAYGGIYYEALYNGGRVSACHAHRLNGANGEWFCLFSNDRCRVAGLVGGCRGVERGLVSLFEIRATVSGFLIVLLCVTCVHRLRRVVANVRLRACEVGYLRGLHRVHGGNVASVKRLNGRVVLCGQVGAGLCFLQVSGCGLRFYQVFLVRWEDGSYVRSREFALSNDAYCRCIQRFAGICRGRLVHSYLAGYGQRVVNELLGFLAASGALSKGGFEIEIQCFGASYSFSKGQNGGAGSRYQGTRYGVVFRSASL